MTLGNTVQYNDFRYTLDEVVIRTTASGGEHALCVRPMHESQHPVIVLSF